MTEDEEKVERELALRRVAFIAVAIDQLLKFGYCHKASWLHKPLVTVAEATVLVDYYLERGIVDAFSHEQAPLLWRNKTAGNRAFCHLVSEYNYNGFQTPREYVWEFVVHDIPSEGDSLRLARYGYQRPAMVRYSIPIQTTNELFAQIEKGDPELTVDPMNIPIGYQRPRPFHLNQPLNPGSLQKWQDFLVWLEKRRRTSEQ